MDYYTNLLLWTDRCAFLLQQVCVAATAAFVLFRLPMLRRAIALADAHWPSRCLVIGVFGAMAVLGTHSGTILDVRQAIFVERPPTLGTDHASLDIREVIVVVAGLTCGIRVGLCVGLMAALDRYALGSFVAESAALASAILGLGAGLLRRFRPEDVRSPVKAALIGAAAAVIQRLIILELAEPFDYAFELTRYLWLSKLATNMLGCGLFVMIMRVVENDRLELMARHAEIRVLQAQVDPHFLMNTLNAIKSLIRTDPDRARSYVVKLGQFFLHTRSFARLNSIPLRLEREHLRQYLDFQQLRFDRAVAFQEYIEPAALDAHFPPRTLQTLVENSLRHGFDRSSETPQLTLHARVVDGRLRVEVADNGRGIPAERLVRLGLAPVPSALEGGGFALYQLRQSLALAFGQTARMDIVSEEGVGTRVRLSLPLRHEAW